MRPNLCIKPYHRKFLKVKTAFVLTCLLLTLKSFSQLSISGFSPASGQVGTSVTITGNNFSTTPANNIVYFGASRGSVTASTATSITVTVPNGATYQPITVTTGGLIASTLSPFDLTFPGGANSFVNTSFSPKVDFATPAWPYSVIACDLDIDGKPDCITANKTANSISVFRNTSAGGSISFATRIDLATGSGPRNVSFGDMDGDGMQDILVSNTDANTISIFRNTSTSGNISFAPKVDINTPVTPGRMAIGDLNNDGKQDIAIACEFANSVRVLNNNSIPGSISFSIAADLSPGTQPNAVAIGDLDGDGKPDLAITRVAYVIAVYRNNTSGGAISFDPKIDVPIVGGSPRNILINDVDFDNKSEMIIAENGTDQVGIFKNTGSVGSIAFASIQHFQAGTTTMDVSISDLNGDGKPDLVAANYSANSISVLKNTFSGAGVSFATKTDYTCGNGPYGVFMADIEGDGKPEIITANATPNTISVLRNKVNEPSITSFTPVVGVSGTLITITGINFTGTTAVSFGGTAASSFTVVNDNTITATVGAGASGSVSITNPYATGSLAGFQYQSQLPPVINSFTPMVASSGASITINGNNFNSTAANNTVYFGSVKANVTAANNTALTVTAPLAATYDPLTVTANNLTAYSILPFNRTFTGVVNAFTPLSFSEPLQFTSNIDVRDIVMGDVDGDGKSDAIISGVSGGSEHLVLLRNTSTGGTISFATMMDIAPFSSSFAYEYISLGDLDGDGKLDVVATSSGFVTLIKNTSTVGNISFAPVVQYQNFSGPAGVSIADIDGDGKPDVCITVPGTGNGNIASVYRNTSSGGTLSLAAKMDFTVGINPRNLITKDFDKDGKTDIVTVNANGATVTILKNTSIPGAISFANGITLSANDNSENLTAGDLDGDGYLDIAVTNSGVYPGYNNTVCVFRNTSTTGNISFAPKIDLNAGSSTHDVAVTDLDGDGKPELVVTNYMAYTVSVFKNNSNAGSINFANDIEYPAGNWPMQLALGDCDGDGYPEISYLSGLYGFLILRSQVNIPPLALTPPVITSLSPPSGNINSSMTINGNNFSSTSSDNTVYLGSVKATVTAATATALNVTVPMAASYKQVTVARFGLSAYSHKPFNVTFADGGAPFTSNFFKSRVDIPSVTSPNGIASTDLDGDGKPDIIVSNSNGVTVYRNTSISSSVVFAQGINFAAGFSPVGVFIADINIDGKQDLVVASYGISILINTSTGAGNISFGAAQDLAALNCRDVAIGDIDKDGRPDIAFTHNLSGGVTVLRNLYHNGTVSFVRINDYITGNATCQVTIGDVTGDNYPDLVVTNNGSNTVSVLRNITNTSGIAFSPAVDFTVNNPSETALADVDNDGKLDMLVLGNSNTPTIAIFKNTANSGVISFANKVDFAAGKNPINISVTDLNGDAKPDIAVVNNYDSSVSALKNTTSNGIISFDNRFDYSVGSGSMGIVTEDWNADSVVDIATVNSVANNFSILINNHNSPVISSINPTTGIVGTLVTITGFNFVGVTSVKFGGTNAASFTVVSPNTITAITGEGSNGAVTVTTPLGTASYESFSFAPPIITSFTPLSAAVGATVTISGNNFSVVPANNIVYLGSVRAVVTASSTISISVTVPAGSSYGPITVTIHNMTAYSPKPFSLGFSTGSGPLTSSSFGTKIDLTTGSTPSSCAIKDLDGDGKPELIAPSPANDNITIFRNTTTGSSFSVVTSTITGNFGALKFIKTGDFDGDGKPDLAVTDYDARSVLVFRNTSTVGNISFASAIIFDSGDEEPLSTAVDDIDADGKPDIAIANGFGIYSVLRNTSTVGNISFTRTGVAISNHPVFVELADLDNDGKPDMITSDNTNVQVRIHKNTSTPGNISFTTAAVITFDGFPWDIATGDLNNDGKLDIAISLERLPGPPTITVLQNTTSGGTISVARVADLAIDGYHGLAIGDVNGDGKQDLIAPGYTGTSFVSVFRNLGTGSSISFDNRINYTVDLAPTFVTTGDVNVDGKTDIITTNTQGGSGGSLTVLLNQMTIVTGIPNIPLSDLSLRITPNPFKESITIKAGKTLQNVNLQLINGRGQIVYSEFRKIILNGELFQINTPKLSPGMYALKISTDKGQSSVKLIKQR